MKLFIFLNSFFFVNFTVFAAEKMNGLFGNKEEAKNFVEELKKERSPENQQSYEFLLKLLYQENKPEDLESLAELDIPLDEMISFAILYNKPDHLKKLLSLKRFNLESKDKDGFTALHEAAYLLRKECVEALLEAGAKKEIFSHQGQTALDLVFELENKQGYLEEDPQGFLSKVYQQQRSLSLGAIEEIYSVDLSNLDEVKRLLTEPDLETEDEGYDSEWVQVENPNDASDDF